MNRISFKVKRDLVNDLTGEVVEGLIKQSDMRCPVCNIPWPLHMTEKRVTYACPLDPYWANITQSLSHPARFARAVVESGMGVCPVCGQ